MAKMGDGVWGGSLGEWLPVKVLSCTVRGKDGQLAEWKEVMAEARVCATPFAEGAMRVAFQAEMRFAHEDQPVQRFVLKASKTPMNDDDLRADAHMQS